MIVFRNAISPAAVAELNAMLGPATPGQRNPSGGTPFPHHPKYLELMAHPPAVEVLRVMLGDWFRLDHAYGIDMAPHEETAQNLQ